MDTPSIHDLFRQWCNAELAIIYAEPCSSEVIDYLVEGASACQRKLAAVPASDPAELLLKLFPILVANSEPAGRFTHPLIPDPSVGNGDAVLQQEVVRDMRRLCPEIAAVMALPNPRERERC